MTKLADFLSAQKIDTRRLLVASKTIEALGDEDRAIRFAKIRVKKNKATDAQKEKAQAKGKSGKAVSAPLLGRALVGKEIPSAAKTRITRAVNRILEQKKKSTVRLEDLF
ncbi:MAG: hypothetical protein KF901_30650 [Myxococcales bacterium]|nr:hypothetical protein [Myxococcales bacterium]